MMNNIVSTEYMIQWTQPPGYDTTDRLRQLPSPISRDMREIYNFAVKPEGFYLIDRGVDPNVAAVALRVFVDEALSHTTSVLVRRI